MQENKVDAVTVEIVGNLLLSIAEEIGVVLIKSSYSSNIKERRDCSSAVFDAQGNLIAQAEHIPMHLGSMLDSIQAIIARYTFADIAEGDMFIANDPYKGGGSHLPDIVVAAPVFARGKLIAWVANIAHHSDIGGIVPGSTSGDTQCRYIFEKQIRLLEQAGATAGDVISVRGFAPSYVTDTSGWDKAYSELFHDIRPCSMLLGINKLNRPTQLVEIEMTAIIGCAIQ